MAAYDFRMPNITGNDREQLAQIRSYLYQFIPQLQWALNNLDTSSASNYVAQQVVKTGTAQKTPSVNAEATFNAIKSLIIASADIVQAYYEEINRRLSGLYVAESDFGTYKEKTDHRITENSNGITQSFTNIQTVSDALNSTNNTVDGMSGEIDGVANRVGQTEKSIKSLDQYVLDTKASIRTGILYYVGDDGKETDDMEAGTPVYGVEVGQKIEKNGVETFNQYARFISNRLSFYDKNGIEVAYIGDKNLYITAAEVLETFRIGKCEYKVDVATGDVVTKWVGGNE